MADTEVTVSMEDVVMVKAVEEEEDPDDKTQVILQLQPISAGQVQWLEEKRPRRTDLSLSISECIAERCHTTIYNMP